MESIIYFVFSAFISALLAVMLALLEMDVQQLDKMYNV